MLCLCVSVLKHYKTCLCGNDILLGNNHVLVVHAHCWHILGSQFFSSLCVYTCVHIRHVATSWLVVHYCFSFYPWYRLLFNLTVWSVWQTRPWRSQDSQYYTMLHTLHAVTEGTACFGTCLDCFWVNFQYLRLNTYTSNTCSYTTLVGVLYSICVDQALGLIGMTTHVFLTDLYWHCVGN